MQPWSRSYLLLVHADRYLIVPEDGPTGDPAAEQARRQQFVHLLSSREAWLADADDLRSLGERVSSFGNETHLFLILPLGGASADSVTFATDTLRDAGHMCAIAEHDGLAPWAASTNREGVQIMTSHKITFPKAASGGDVFLYQTPRGTDASRWANVRTAPGESGEDTIYVWVRYRCSDPEAVGVGLDQLALDDLSAK